MGLGTDRCIFLFILEYLNIFKLSPIEKISSKINYFDIALSLNIFKYSKINKNIHLCHLWITEACKDKYNKNANSKPMSHFVKIKLNEALNLKISKNKNVFKTKIITFLFLLIFLFKALFSFIPKCVIYPPNGYSSDMN